MVIKKELKGRFFADKGYLSKDLFTKFYRRGLILITGIKSNMSTTSL